MTELAAASVDLAVEWLVDARDATPARMRRRTRLLARLLGDDEGLAFAMAFMDRVMRAPTRASSRVQA